MHSPTLDSILMVEKAIQKHNGRYGKYQLWKALPKKMMYQTFQLILQYLISSDKITIQRDKIFWSHNIIQHHQIQVSKRVKPNKIHYVM